MGIAKEKQEEESDTRIIAKRSNIYRKNERGYEEENLKQGLTYAEVEISVNPPTIDSIKISNLPYSLI